MYYELSREEIQQFIKIYLNPYDEDIKKINKISCISYEGVKEYMLNDRYIIKMY